MFISQKIFFNDKTSEDKDENRHLELAMTFFYLTLTVPNSITSIEESVMIGTRFFNLYHL